jgi:hypothetical protein
MPTAAKRRQSRNVVICSRVADGTAFDFTMTHLAQIGNSAVVEILQPLPLHVLLKMNMRRFEQLNPALEAAPIAVSPAISTFGPPLPRAFL